MQHQTDHYSRRVGPGWICFSAGLEMWQTQGGELGAPWHRAGCPLGSVPVCARHWDSSGRDVAVNLGYKY